MHLIDYRTSRDNNFDIMRLIAAFFVLFGHSFTLLLTTPEHRHISDPVSTVLRQINGFNLGLPAIGVSLFFLMSGYLVTKSFHQRSTAKSFIVARVMRIYPALTVNVIACVILGAAATTLPLEEYLSSHQVHRFFYHNASALKTIYTLPGVFENLPWEEAVNGSLWTLRHEVRMYCWVLLLGLFGVLHRRYLFNAFAILTVGLFVFNDTQFLLSGDHAKLWLFFLIGMGAYLNADYIPMRWSSLAAATGLMLLAAQLAPQMAYDIIFAVWLSYTLLMLAYARYVPQINVGRLGDFSYGLYLYAFPVQQTFIYILGPDMSPWVLVIYTTATALLFAIASWFIVEKPALDFLRRKR